MISMEHENAVRYAIEKIKDIVEYEKRTPTKKDYTSIAQLIALEYEIKLFYHAKPVPSKIILEDGLHVFHKTNGKRKVEIELKYQFKGISHGSVKISYSNSKNLLLEGKPADALPILVQASRDAKSRLN